MNFFKKDNETIFRSLTHNCFGLSAPVKGTNILPGRHRAGAVTEGTNHSPIALGVPLYYHSSRIRRSKCPFLSMAKLGLSSFCPCPEVLLIFCPGVGLHLCCAVPSAPACLAGFPLGWRWVGGVSTCTVKAMGVLY